MSRLPLMLMLSTSLALAGCATTGYGTGGGYGNNYPNDPYYPGNADDRYGNQRLIATVQDVDPRNGRLLLGVNDRGRQSRVEVFFDNNTTLYYQGQRYPVGGLERGDEVAIEAVQSRGRLWATRIQVVRNVRDYGGRDYDRY